MAPVLQWTSRSEDHIKEHAKHAMKVLEQQNTILELRRKLDALTHQR